ncbi:MAG: hypothetical protein ACRDRW_06700 [Pseudonocardiaceae bacterium]
MGSDHDEAAAGPPAVGGLGGLEWVYIPAQTVTEGANRAELELRRRRDGGTALLAYTSLELLVAGCGRVTIWWVWLPPIIFGLAVYWGTSKNWLAAGATWLQNGEVWVDVYELVTIDVKASGAKLRLRLTDSAGRTIGALSLADTQRNQALWDLTILKLPGGRGQHRDGS